MAGVSEIYNLGLKKFPIFDSNTGKALSIGATEYEIVVGIPPTNDYPTFPTQLINGNVIIFHYKQGSLHNTDADANIMQNYLTITGIDGNGDPIIEIGTPTVLIPPLVGYSNTGPSLQWGLNGRIILKYQRLGSVGTGTQGQQVWVLYSDDFGQTWTEPVLMTNDYPPPDIILATGEGFTWKGELYQACHSFASDPYEGPLYKSTDNGVTWTRVGYVNRPSGWDFEEQTLLLRNDGLPMCFIRSAQLGGGGIGLAYSLATDLTKWSDPGMMLVALSDAKPAVGQFASGGIVLGGRNESDGRRTTFSYSADGGKTFIEQDADDNEEIGMYTCFSYHAASDRIIAIYAYVQAGGTLTDGPTTLSYKILKEVDA